jgi:hypothetical protein
MGKRPKHQPRWSPQALSNSADATLAINGLEIVHGRLFSASSVSFAIAPAFPPRNA